MHTKQKADRAMPHHEYLIIGGGMTADAAIQGIRKTDTAAAVGVIGADAHRPYNRPPLTKGLWKGDPPDSIWRKTDHRGVEFFLGRTVRAIDPAAKRATDDRGTAYTYGKLLLATGGIPRRLPFGGDDIIYYRTLDDYERLRALTQHGDRFVVIGAGFIGSEIAAALAMNQKRVTMVFPEPAIGARSYPADLAQFVTDVYRQKDVEVVAGDAPVSLAGQGSRLLVRTREGREYQADGVVAGLGIQPATDLARSAGIETANGIVVSRFLQTTRADIYAAGDVAEFYNPALDNRLRVEHEDNANTMGETAGRVMAGDMVPYDHLPFFYSDLFELGYEAVGELDARHEIVADWKEPHRQGVVYYLHEGRVRGVLLWNTWGQVDAARALIADPGPFTAEALKGRLPAGS
jgi:3-phenylpropionate/trans-cinnamate dioxygenase ferredoxin reductase component